MNIWKFGCNWAGNKNSFYEFIRRESIAIGHVPDANFKLDDLVLVAKGYKILAIVQIDETPQPITSSSFETVTKDYGIEWAKTTIYSNAEWFELPHKLQFEYRCQKGAVRVGDKDIIELALQRWKNRK